MIEKLLISTIGIVLLMVAWTKVQALWRRHFADFRGTDPLAGRLRCHGCRCENDCEQEPGRGQDQTTRDD